MDTALAAVLFGLGGAVGWGASNFFAAKATREKNALVTVFTSQLILFLTMGLIALIFGLRINLSWELAVFLAFNYLIFTLGLLISYKAYAIGPVSITSPIVGANSLIVVAVSVLVFGEVLRMNQWLGIVILFVGLFAATYEKKKREKISLKSSGVFLAFVALVLIGVGIAGFVYAIGQAGWATAVLLGYFFTAFWVGLYLTLKSQIKRLHFTQSLAGLTVFQLLGTVSVSVGVERTLAALVVPVSSVAPLVTSLMGLILFHEKIFRYKLLGVVLIVAGRVVISL
ncbi:GRP family sugar transporter [soil metagenome]